MIASELIITYFEKNINISEEICMEQKMKSILWQQFGAAIDSLGKAIDHCPETHWTDDSKYYQIWYISFHTIFWLDYLLSAPADNFKPPAPFTMSEMDPSGIIPEPAYTKDQLKTYLAHARHKSHDTIMGLTGERADEMCSIGKISMTFEELLLYIMRHVQHHAAQLNLLLRQKTDSSPGWTFQTE